MSILTRIKDLLKKKEEDEDKEEEESDKEGDEQEEKEGNGPVELVKKEDNRHQALAKWKSTVENVENHPLSQAKIINSKILNDLYDVLDGMNNKLDKLEKLDEILLMLRKQRKELQEKDIESSKLDQAISKLEDLTVKDREVVDKLKEVDETDAETLAEELDISRSTASFRLNRLYKKGVLEKKSKGKNVIYALKEDVE